jgi:aryl-alcohol dehydrogenase-like predicted oxidoreductase
MSTVASRSKGFEVRSVPLGPASEPVSIYCLGTNYFGTRVPRPAAFALLDRYAEAGGRFVDTSNVYANWVPGYHGGESEATLGAWMRERRTRLFVATKVGVGYGEVPGGLRAAQIIGECEKSLRRLGVEAIDLYYPHRDDRACPLEETLESFNRLIRAGKVRFIGASNYVPWRLEEARGLSRANGWAEFCCLQLRHSYLLPRAGSVFPGQVAAGSEAREYCQARGLRLLAYSPLLHGAYTRADRPLPPQYTGPDNERRLAVLRQVALELDATPNQVVLAWLMQCEPAVIPVVGSSTLTQLEENLSAVAIGLPASHLARLEAAQSGSNVVG